MEKSLSTFLVLALLISSSYCLRNNISQLLRQKHARQFLAKEATTIRSSASSAIKYKMNGTANKAENQFKGSITKLDGTFYTSWDLSLMDGDMHQGWTSEFDTLVAQTPENQGDPFQGLVHDQDFNVIGSFSFTISDEGKVSGQYQIDTSNKLPLYRFDVDKSSLSGKYYRVTSKSGRKHIDGDVAIRNTQNDEYQGQLTQRFYGWACKNPFSYRSSSGAGVSQFTLSGNYSCSQGLLLAKTNSSSGLAEQSKGMTTKAVLIKQTATKWIYGHVQ